MLLGKKYGEGVWECYIGLPMAVMFCGLAEKCSLSQDYVRSVVTVRQLLSCMSIILSLTRIAFLGVVFPADFFRTLGLYSLL